MSFLRAAFGYPISADMDCAAVIALQNQQEHLSPEAASEQNKVYGALLRALIQAKGNQPPIQHGYAHPERFHPATKTKPARPIIPRSQWTKRLWMNHMADRYASHKFDNNLAPGLQPQRVFRIQVEDLLSQIMPPDSLFWVHARMPTVNSVCALKSPEYEAAEYLAQRDMQATETSRNQSRYYPDGYWASSVIGLLKPVLDSLTGKRFSDRRTTLLNLIWDYAPTGRRKGLFKNRSPEPCPLCGQSDSLDHVVLRCSHLHVIRQSIHREVSAKFIRGSTPASSTPPPGATPRVREYIRNYIALSFNNDTSGSIPDSHAVALWLARPQQATLLQLDDGFINRPLTLLEHRYLRKEMRSVMAKLLTGAGKLWQARCKQTVNSPPEFSSMTAFRLTPTSLQPSISSAFTRNRPSQTAPTLNLSPNTSSPSIPSSVHSMNQSLSLTPNSYSYSDDEQDKLLLSLDSPSPTEISESQVSQATSEHSLTTTPSPQLDYPCRTERTQLPPEASSSLADDPECGEIPELAKFISIADLNRTPGATAINFSLFAFAARDEDFETDYAQFRRDREAAKRAPSLSSQGNSAQSESSHGEEIRPTSRPPQRNQPPRATKVQMAHTANHSLLSDTTSDGKLPDSFVSLKGNKEYTKLHQYGPSDWQPSWVQPSHFCDGGGLGLFFRVPKGQTIPAGTMIGVYSGRDSFNLSITFAAAQKLFRSSDYVLSHQPAGYVVDGQNGPIISGPARCNDNFDMFNCYLGWNPNKKRMELFTKAPMSEGYYEALVNYNEPGKSSAYWTPERLRLLSPEARARCSAHYHL